MMSWACFVPCHVLVSKASCFGIRPSLRCRLCLVARPLFSFSVLVLPRGRAGFFCSLGLVLVISWRRALLSGFVHVVDVVSVTHGIIESREVTTLSRIVRIIEARHAELTIDQMMGNGIYAHRMVASPGTDAEGKTQRRQAASRTRRKGFQKHCLGVFVPLLS